MPLKLSRRPLLGACLLALPGLCISRAALALERIKIRDLYKTEAVFSDAALALEGQTIEIPGFMAPPLKADAAFFVLTKRPMSVCPFCETKAEWPSEIVFVRTDERYQWLPFNVPIVTTGVLQLGFETDADTGFVSKVRLVDASIAAA